MEHLVQPTLAFIAVHAGWAFAVMFIAAFGESLAFVSLLFPGSSLLIAAGALMATGAPPHLLVLAGAVLGAVLGDAVSYWIGRRFGHAIARIWPFTRHPDLLPGGIRFFARYGGMSVFIGRFFGPVRAVIPLAAGVMQMPPGRFWVANMASALVWAPMLLLFGDVVGKIGQRLVGSANLVILVLGGFILFGLGGVVGAVLRARRRRR
ncbi:MAG TPA: DedA family protein [Stellaceae bacterium]|jgi:membrane protein DedA with SNARE-associated domain